MSNNLVSQPLSIPSTQMTPLEAIPSRVESSMRDVQMDFSRNVPDESASQPSLLRQQSRSAGTMSLFQNNAGYLDGREKIMMPQRSLVPMEDMGSMFSNQVGQELPMLNKRKAPTGPMPSIHSPRSTIMPNKRAAQVEHRPWLQQSAQNRKNMPGQSTPTPGVKHLPAANRKLGLVESISPRSGLQRLSVPKNQMSNAQPSPKVQSDSSGSVRSKMRESLAAAFALVSHEESRSPAGKDSEKSDLSAPSSRVDTRPVPNPGDAVVKLHEVQEGKLTSCNFGSHHVRNSPSASQEAFAIDRSGDSNMPSVSNVQDLQSGSVLIPEDLPFADNFFVKDELLQGNGLSWVLDSDTNVGERRGNQDGEMKEKVPDELNGRRAMAFQSPEVLASRIEAELFKLFGGVNKKYKEKGRSLLFNLKDRSNPELRERVVSGEIPPERLCSMTAEELASKELSQWRMAKAEEFAQMVVLPDSEVDMKRLVKKTHKGEFQVEVDQYDVSAEVPSGVNSSTRDRKKAKNDQESPEKKPGERDENMKAGDRKSDLAVQGAAYTLTIPTEDHASDVDIMEENVTKDLPPIVSLDEFMECLESEPPFRDLQEDAGKSGPASEKDLKSRSLEESPDMAERKSAEILQPASEEDLKTKSPERSPNNTTDMTEEKSSKVDETSSPADVDIRSSDHHGEYDSKDSTVALKGELIWEGSLQLIITTISVIGIFKR